MIHIAGKMDEVGLQLCMRCGCILTDYRNAMVPEGSPPLSGWEEKAFVEVITGNPKYSGITNEPPDCEKLH